MNLRDRISKLVGKNKERFVVVMEAGGSLDIYPLLIDKKKKRVVFGEKYSISNVRKIKKPVFPMPTRAIIASSSKKATTVEDSVVLKREIGSGPIKESEVDTIIFKAFWSFLNRYRPWAAEKMSVNELDLVLAEASVQKMLLGKYEIINPVGFEGEDITLFFRATFVPRDFQRVAENLSSWADKVRIVESGAVLPILLGKPRSLFLTPFGEKMIGFSVTEDEVRYLTEIDWGPARLLKAISEALACDLDIAEEILERYTERAASKNISRIVEKALKEELKNLHSRLNRILKRLERKEVIFVTDINIPPEVISRAKNFKVIYLGDFSALKLMKDFDFVIRNSSKPADIGRSVAFADFVFSGKRYRGLNDVLKRRAGWLIAADRSSPPANS